jgi:hypothetical protein
MCRRPRDRGVKAYIVTVAEQNGSRQIAVFVYVPPKDDPATRAVEYVELIARHGDWQAQRIRAVREDQLGAWAELVEAA